jgi:hydroxycarboxylate dehydrogenase B
MPGETGRRVAAGELRSFLVGIVSAMGADGDVAVETAEHLVGANLAGHDSHGVLRIVDYVQELDQGVLVPSARGTPLKEAASLLLFDAQRGFGQWSTRRTLDWCLEHAATGGVAAAAVRHSNHIGRLGHYAEAAARRGFVSIVGLGQVGPGIRPVTPFGGSTPLLGTNPWCFGVPAAGRAPFVADFATSQVAEGKVQVARYAGRRLPDGLVIDSAGRPTSDPADLYQGGALLPLGGLLTGHKGYGLGMAAALIGGLAEIEDGDAPSARSGGSAAGASTGDPRMAGVFMVVFDPGWFGSADRFLGEVKEVLEAAEATPPAGGVEAVLVPGDPEARSRGERLTRGIAVPDSVWDRLALISERFRVTMPGLLPAP